MYHRVVDEKFDIFNSSYQNAKIITPLAKFKKQMEKLKRDANVLSLKEAIIAAKKNRLPQNAYVLTFDDGFADNYKNVFPLLKKMGLPATFFIMGDAVFFRKMRWLDRFYFIVDRTKIKKFSFRLDDEAELTKFDLREKEDLNGMKSFLRNCSQKEKDKFLDRISESLKVKTKQEDTDRLYMSLDNILDLVNSGMDIGVHTMTHPDLGKIPFSDAKKEILQSKKLVSKLIPGGKMAFAYPFGGPGTYNKKIINFLKANGFSCACTSIPGINNRLTPLFELKRIPGEQI